MKNRVAFKFLKISVGMVCLVSTAARADIPSPPTGPVAEDSTQYPLNHLLSIVRPTKVQDDEVKSVVQGESTYSLRGQMFIATYDEKSDFYKMSKNFCYADAWHNSPVMSEKGMADNVVCTTKKSDECPTFEDCLGEHLHNNGNSRERAMTLRSVRRDIENTLAKFGPFDSLDQLKKDQALKSFGCWYVAQVAEPTAGSPAETASVKTYFEVEGEGQTLASACGKCSAQLKDQMPTVIEHLQCTACDDPAVTKDHPGTGRSCLVPAEFE